MIGWGPTITYCPTLHLLLKNGRPALPEDAELLGELAALDARRR